MMRRLTCMFATGCGEYIYLPITLTIIALWDHALGICVCTDVHGCNVSLCFTCVWLVGPLKPPSDFSRGRVQVHEVEVAYLSASSKLVFTNVYYNCMYLESVSTYPSTHPSYPG